jgi:hypothetical protein
MKKLLFFLALASTHLCIGEISDALIKSDLAEVDIDPEAFEVKPDKTKSSKTSKLDDIEFISDSQLEEHRERLGAEESFAPFEQIH